MVVSLNSRLERNKEEEQEGVGRHGEVRDRCGVFAAHLSAREIFY